ncbi:T-cell surface glycoprotein CD8 alpha chain [Latimeria chalumnae]|uniref:T-cell surface glycoprotein CD8 alpha chain n=1 Tax=Latimeria chalumnae TaxID=7897 RepID=UPI00313E4F34
MSNIFWFFLFLDSIAYSYQKKLQQPDTFLPVEEGKDVTLKCRSQDSSTLDQGGYWFRRSRDKTQEFVLYFSSTSRIKLSSDLDSNRFSATKSTSEVTLTIKPFKKEDSGIYYCLVLQNSVLIFGTGTELVIPGSSTTMTTITTTTTERKITAKPCDYKTTSPTSSPVSGFPCKLYIWTPLAGASLLLLITLIITIIVCNNSRKKRCPHHIRKRSDLE